MAKVRGKAVESKNKKNGNSLFFNYFKLTCLILGTIFLTIFVRNWYHSSVESELNTSIIGEVLIHVLKTDDEMYSYIKENQNVVIYIGVASDLDCRNLEKNFVNVIEDRKLEDDIIYLNLNDFTEQERLSFFDEFNDNYEYSSLINRYPVLVYIENGEIEDVASETASKKLTVGVIEDFLDDNKIVSIN